MRQVAGFIQGAALVALALGSASAGEQVRLLTGFEREQMLAWGAKTDGQVLRWGGVWIRRGDATQGEWALVAKRGLYLRSGAPYNWLRRNGNLFKTWPWFRQRLPQDWSGYGKLRVDLKSTDSAGRVRIELEDEITTPLLRAVYAFPKGKWVTLEFDLAEASRPRTIALSETEARRLGTSAVKVRLLNLKKMANIYIYLEYLEKPSTVLLDNLRLVPPGGEPTCKYPVLTSTLPLPEPRALPMSHPLPPAAPDGFRPDTAPVERLDIRPVDISLAGETCYGRLCGIVRRAFVAADRRHLLLGFLAGYLHVLQSADGGRSWRGLDGERRPTRCYHDANAPSHVAVAAGNDLLYFYTDHCAGGSNPQNMFFRLLRFDGGGWRLGPPRLVDVDCRHCPEFAVRALRLRSGRIWVAWKHYDRFGRYWVRARYSDDAGRTWRDPDSNALIVIDRDNSQGPQRLGVTLWQVEPRWSLPLQRANGRVGEMYSQGSLVLTPFGKHLACFWARSWQPYLVWSRFDGTSWSEPEVLPKPFDRGFPVSAVTVGEREIYLSYRYKGRSRVIRFDGGRWVDDTPPGGRGGVLAVSGSTVLCLWTEREGSEAKVLVSSKAHEGRWTSPRVLATGEVPAGRKGRTGLDLVVPRYAPRGFVPIAFGPHHQWIKFLLLPTER